MSSTRLGAESGYHTGDRPQMATFLAKFFRDPKKGIDRSWRSCQDKLLDVADPLAKIMDMVEYTKASGSLISPDVLSNWAQRAIIFLGNVNCVISTERRRSLFIKIDPKLGELYIRGRDNSPREFVQRPIYKRIG